MSTPTARRAIDPALFDAGVPVFGICYGFQAMAEALGGTVKRTEGAEFGRTTATVDSAAVLFAGMPGRQPVWMSHRDAVVVAPPGFAVTGRTDGAEIAAFEHPERRLFGCSGTPRCCTPRTVRPCSSGSCTWARASRPPGRPPTSSTTPSPRSASASATTTCCAGSPGGVDSAVAAALVHRAVGDQLTCVFVDHGLLRKGEREQVERDYVAATGIRLITVDASEKFLTKLAGVTDPEAKRKIIGTEFIRTFEEVAAEVIASEGHDDVEFLVQGTLYPDVVESGGGTGTANIKSHHNVGGLPDDLQFELIEPLKALFKDEVRAVGLELGLPESMVWRQPFPGPGLAIRIVGAVDAERLHTVREADAIAREELEAAGLERDVWQFPVVLLADVRSVGVQGDGRTYAHPIVLRPITSEDAMTADWARLPTEVLERISTRITNEVEDVNRVVLDISSKPPATIEWE